MWQAQEGRDHICLAHPVSSESVAVSSDAWLLPTEIRDLNNCFVFGRFLDYKEQQQQQKKRFRLPCAEKEKEEERGEGQKEEKEELLSLVNP